ncbi:MAG: hypothetical protein A3E74_03505 [Omnitrophica bacterium RIFCSPHIGHO2_12_FULL_44_12]|nr:MAG: hypothetical protein A3B72_01570 [Omnitrophica bacterium RIFCSPHIGHO2_02_FULL_45_28]OGW90444.1 MAG: hypothetical protein A3E74_03505 [Omnitrophica bacterium RIFCSPHIGHO2_12_FULL_44_12]OGX02790.1 MAG: hypothetical protein A3J12_02415 [Omnitrophica bacterium RIFCSPLOWO2_02_FULL_44_11]
MGAISCDQSFAPLLNQGAKDKHCVAKMNTLFAPQLLRAEFLINAAKSGLNLTSRGLTPESMQPKRIKKILTNSTEDI